MTVARRRRTFWIAAACAHLALVVCGAAGIAMPRRFVAGRALATYGDYSGANNGYGFFAPSVAPEWRTTFAVCTNEKECIDVKPARPNAEAEALLTTIDALYTEPQVRDLLAASWAAIELGRFPDARAVIVRGSVFDVPSMAAYRTGRRAEWRTIYGYAFRRDASGRR
jgi:hypothetical protein